MITGTRFGLERNRKYGVPRSYTTQGKIQFRLTNIGKFPSISLFILVFVVF